MTKIQREGGVIIGNKEETKKKLVDIEKERENAKQKIKI